MGNAQVHPSGSSSRGAGKHAIGRTRGASDTRATLHDPAGHPARPPGGCHGGSVAGASSHDYRFHVHGLVDGTATAGMHTSQVRETLEAVLTLHVAAVDPTGVAKVRSSLSNVSDRLNGHGQHSSGAATVLNIAPDGRI